MNNGDRKKKKKPDVISHKICKNCKVDKPVNDFYKSKLGLGGVKAVCKECIKPKDASRQKDKYWKDLYITIQKEGKLNE